MTTRTKGPDKGDVEVIEEVVESEIKESKPFVGKVVKVLGDVSLTTNVDDDIVLDGFYGYEPRVLWGVIAGAVPVGGTVIVEGDISNGDCEHAEGGFERVKNSGGARRYIRI